MIAHRKDIRWRSAHRIHPIVCGPERDDRIRRSRLENSKLLFSNGGPNVLKVIALPAIFSSSMIFRFGKLLDHLLIYWKYHENSVGSIHCIQAVPSHGKSAVFAIVLFDGHFCLLRNFLRWRPTGFHHFTSTLGQGLLLDFFVSSCPACVGAVSGVF